MSEYNAQVLMNMRKGYEDVDFIHDLYSNVFMNVKYYKGVNQMTLFKMIEQYETELHLKNFGSRENMIQHDQELSLR